MTPRPQTGTLTPPRAAGQASTARPDCQSWRTRTFRGVTATLLLALSLPALLSLGGCVVVPQNRRGRLADPMMSFSGSRMDAYRNEKLHSTREGAAGGNGQPAGGGCACQ